MGGLDGTEKGLHVLRIDTNSSADLVVLVDVM
jgi:hypothetical protein